jgi:hypothetical protein
MATTLLGIEFGIELNENDMIPLGSLDNLDSQYGRPFIWLSHGYNGKALTNSNEILNIRSLSLSQLLNEKLFTPFFESLLLYQKYDFLLKSSKESGTINSDGGEGSGNFGHKGREGEIGGSAPNGSDATSPDTEWHGQELDDNEKRSINRYTTGLFSQIVNEKLRNGSELTEDEKTTCGYIDSALKKAPTYNGNLKRSINISEGEDLNKFLESMQAGSIVTWDAYTSTTKSDEPYDTSFNVQMTILNSKKGRNISYFNKGENEVLYERGASFYVVKSFVKEGQNKTYHFILFEV